MILKLTLEQCVYEQRASAAKRSIGIPREKTSDIKLSPDFVTIITGVRRCGKSTLLLQLMSASAQPFAYFNFEDPRISGFEVTDFQKLEDVLGNQDVYFFDEIQNVPQWELFVRKLHDQGKTICITGSNASLLSRELGTRLTGRHIQQELYPFSYNEFLSFTKMERKHLSVEQYLIHGGFPAYLGQDDVVYLQQLFRDVLYRDIIVRYGIRNVKTLEQLTLFLLSNTGCEYSLNKLKNTFGIGSANSVADYISWLEDSYLLFSLPRFSWSVKSIAVNPKKIYAIDTGFVRSNSLSFSEDKGRQLENLVYLSLRKRGLELYYYREKGECDFVVRDQNKVTQVIQVCSELNDDNMHREVDGLREAMAFFNLDEGTIVTLTQEDRFIAGTSTIHVVSAMEWLSC